ncbi:L-rhamnose mutarotase [Pedobacter sp.]|jgi:L-rhamnose mutarotase|uniref:L-rhamnose mutarotase n=1 Tax=Pedobacter sp. TaxID=1411316 RepID=UPI002D0F5DF7|nr:L-rhamnose mutarotase [Pedobacter sp.]HWW42468.1 L-rhamnose mutarotase [Pedobacter sp.]
MKLNTIIVLLFGLLLSSCQTTTKDQQVKRFGSITGLKADKLARYKELHANAWPEVLKKIKDCHIRNYSIYLQKIKNEYYLFSYFEYTGEDFDGDMKKMAADPNTQRWWKETDPCQQPLPETAAKKEIWTNMEEVFHTN